MEPKRDKKRDGLLGRAASLALALAAVLLSAGAYPVGAQTCVSCGDPEPTPTPRATPRPSPSAQPTPGRTPSPGGTEEPPGNAIANTLSNLAVSIKQLMDDLSSWLKLSFQAPLDYFAGGLVIFLIVLVFMKMIREDNGTPVHLVFQLIRTVIIVVAMTGSSEAFKLFEDAKADLLASFKTMTDADGNSAGPVELSRLRFNADYKKFVAMHIKEIQGDAKANSDPVGKLWDPTKSAYYNIDHIVSPNDWDAPKLYATLTISRALLSFCDLAVEAISGFIKIGLTIFAGLMIAAAVDKEWGREITYGYLRGVVVFYLLWPPLADVIRVVFYQIASVTMTAFSTPNIKETAGVSSLGNPVVLKELMPYDGYAVLAGCILMVIAALFLIVSPGIAYRMSKGQVFEAFATTASNWIGAIAGQTAELYGARVGAELEQMARMSDLQGGREAAGVRAEAGMKSAEINARAGQLSTKVQAFIQAKQTSATLDADKQKANTQVLAQNQQQITQIWANADAAAQRTGVQRDVQVDMNAIQQQGTAKSIGINAEKDMRATKYNAATDVLVNGPAGMAFGPSAGTAAAAPVHGVINHETIAQKAELQQKLAANVEVAQNQVANVSADRNVAITQQELERTAGAHNQAAQTNVDANNAYNATLQGVNSENYNTQLSTADQVYQLNVEGAHVMAAGEVSAAQITYDYGARAADLSKQASFIRDATRDADRTLQDAMAQNF